jgi:hypothetical protein
VASRPKLAAATPICLVAGAAGAVVASALGLLRNEYDSPGGDTVEFHKWAGLATTLLAMTSALLLTKAASFAKARIGCRIASFAAAALASGVGYLGGEMVFGRNHITRDLFTPERLAPPTDGDTPAADTSHTKGEPGAPPTSVDFVPDIAPVLTENCLKCHGRGKINGKLDLTTRTGAVRGGSDEGLGLLPGQPGKSSIYRKIAATDADVRTPPPGQTSLTKDQIDVVRRWIEEGAKWPDNAVLR